MIPSALLRQSVTVASYEGEGAAGPVFGEPVAYPARVEERRRLLQSGSGEVIASEAVAYLRPDVPIKVGDRVGLFGRDLRVLAVAEMRGLSRIEYLDVTLGRSES